MCKLILLLSILALGVPALAQTKDVRPLTDEEQLTLRNDQVAYLQAKQALTEAATALQNAQNKLSADYSKAYNERSLKDGDAVLCDGPGTVPECKGVLPMQLALKAKLKVLPTPPQQVKK
jgi:hypothetical protein